VEDGTLLRLLSSFVGEADRLADCDDGWRLAMVGGSGSFSSWIAYHSVHALGSAR